MRRKLYRTAFSLAVVIGVVLVARWTIRTAVTRAYRAEGAFSAAEVPVAPAPKVWSLAQIVPKELHVNIAGLAVGRHAERLGMPYALAVDVADEKARSAGWERLDNENAITLRNLSGMERIYRTPGGSIVLREVRAVVGNDSIMEDFTMPVEMVQDCSEQTTPDVLARRSAAKVKALMPPVLRDVIAGSPMLTELIERGGGAALIVRCASDMPADATTRAIESAARKAGWAETRYVSPPGVKIPAAAPGAAGVPLASWTKRNLSFHFEVVPRGNGGGCDVNYRFADDESFIPTKGKADED